MGQSQYFYKIPKQQHLCVQLHYFDKIPRKDKISARRTKNLGINQIFSFITFERQLK